MVTMGIANKLKVDKDISIDPTVLFQRFLIIQQNAEVDISDVFKYELAPYPPALFERNYVMLTADKPKLKEALIGEAMSKLKADPSMALHEKQLDDLVVLHGNKKAEFTEDKADVNEAKFIFENADIPKTDRSVIGGGYLLHKILWQKGVPFQKIMDSYTEYTINHLIMVPLMLSLMGMSNHFQPRVTHMERGGKLIIDKSISA